jgi:hypothetical protein
MRAMSAGNDPTGWPFSVATRWAVCRCPDDGDANGTQALEAGKTIGPAPTPPDRTTPHPSPNLAVPDRTEARTQHRHDGPRTGTGRAAVVRTSLGCTTIRDESTPKPLVGGTSMCGTARSEPKHHQETG